MTLPMYTIKKVLNNSVVICQHDTDPEVILLGKGIGFGKKAGDLVDPASVPEKVYQLTDKEEQSQYRELVKHVDEDFIAFMQEIVGFIETSTGKKVDQHIHIGLTDHLFFTMKRIEQGMEVTNPFLLETESLYPNEYSLAERIVDMIHERLDVLLPDAEIGFIALHIHSATTFKNVLEVNRHNQIIGLIVQTIESRLNVKMDRSSLDYKRLLRHLRYAVERVATGELVEAPQKIEKVLREEYPLCYSTAWELMGIMERELKRPVPRGEATYLTMHLQRLTSR
ncbi:MULTISPECIES: glucose PTS transporter transcription antiterminator GlcT [Exiguobacterium]|uniref:glucose PTS transporter transcription antiterminator GlcT n=1 Tax=Exiguobacterium TaxID=33986 RepID=UPI001BEAA8EB|nr:MULTISPECIES: transcription antiterminator [Exiguobacterium]MCT4782827.1 transcription antiterminator [Exiguobacterium himgiriensis]